MDLLSCLPHLFDPGDREPRQRLSLRNVRRDHKGKRKETLDDRFDRIGSKERRAALGHHHRIDHQSLDTVRLHFRCNDVDDPGVGEHPGFGGIDGDIFEDRIDLSADELRRQVVDPLDAHGVLGRHGCDRRCPEDAQGGEGFQIGLDPRPAPGIRTCNGQCAAHRLTSFHVHLPDLPVANLLPPHSLLNDPTCSPDAASTDGKIQEYRSRSGSVPWITAPAAPVRRRMEISRMASWEYRPHIPIGS